MAYSGNLELKDHEELAEFTSIEIRVLQKEKEHD